MRRIISFFLLSFATFQFAFAQVYAVDPGNPNEWDFGKVKQGEVLKHDFLFKNKTLGILKITGVNTSCGCTASQSDKKTLKPGESTAIKVSFNSRGYSGAVQQYVYVNTDNVDSAIIKFVIKAEVVK